MRPLPLNKSQFDDGGMFIAQVQSDMMLDALICQISI